MNSIILTGFSGGLGREIHDLLIKAEIPGWLIFISRGHRIEEKEGITYLQIDLGEAVHEAAVLKLEIATDSKKVVFINNAATIRPIGNAVNISPSSIEEAMRVNCLGPLCLAQHLTNETQKIGAKLFILNVSSGAAHHPVKGWLSYCVSKAAAVMAFDVLTAENDHIEVLHYDPGVMDTDMQYYIRQQSKDIMPDVDLFKGFMEDGILKKPREVAEQVISIVLQEIQ